MNIIERQTELSKSLFAINSTAVKAYVSMQKENLERYFEVNREFGTRLPEIKDVSSVIELQKEYGETLWNNAKEALQAQNELLTATFNETKEAVKSAYTSEEVVAEKPKAKAKAKPKAKAKKAAA